jgi:hypothetical protein
METMVYNTCHPYEFTAWLLREGFMFTAWPKALGVWQFQFEAGILPPAHLHAERLN